MENNIVCVIALSLAAALMMSSQVHLALTSSSSQKGVVMLTDSGDLIVNASVGGSVIINGVNITSVLSAQTSSIASIESTAAMYSITISTAQSTVAAQSSEIASLSTAISVCQCHCVD